MIIGGLQKTSFLDYPDKISTIIFTSGCNFRCGYCHNPELINSKTSKYSTEEIIQFLKTRTGKIDGVVITGGEPCIHKDLIDFIIKIKELDFLVKLDSNGSYPDVIEKCIPYIDYIAMDIKAPLYKYQTVINSPVNIDNIQRSITLIMKSNLDYEFRTTVLKSMLNIDDFKAIGNLISSAKKYYLQKFVPSKTLDKTLLKESSYTDEEFKEIIAILQKQIQIVEIR